MKYKILVYLLLLINSSMVLSQQLDFECDQVPGPLKIDCPNDEFFSLGIYPGSNLPNPEIYADMYQWGADYMDFAKGWYYSNVTTRVGVLDSGLIPDIHISETKANIRHHGSGTFAVDNYGNPIFDTNLSLVIPPTGVHGELIMSVLGSKSNNSLGMSGLCKNCSYSYVTQQLNLTRITEIEGYDPLENCNGAPNPTNPNIYYCAHKALDRGLNQTENAIQNLINEGSQVVNISNSLSDKLSVENHFGFLRIKTKSISREPYAACQFQESLYGHKQEICDILENAKKRDIIVIVSAGNDLQSEMGWPANDRENVIGIAGTDSLGNLWQESPCPFMNDGISGNDLTECGTNFNNTYTKFAAPSESILTSHPNGDYNPSTSCVDSNFGTSTDGYQRCSGTSFAAPHMASLIALIRSLNPLISFDDVKQVLWDSKVNGLADQRYAIPRAGKATEIVLGKSDGNQVVNRLTPMFRLKTISNVLDGQKSYLSTIIPQVATSALFGTYLSTPEADTGKPSPLDYVYYKPDTSSNIVDGYENFKSENQNNETTRAPFFIFGGHRNPFNNDAPDLLPLYHMARPLFRGLFDRCSVLADHAYSTNLPKFGAFSNFCQFYHIEYLYEGIEGYILPTCPTTGDCFEDTGNVDAAQCLKLRYSFDDKSFALIMASETSEVAGLNSTFGSYGQHYKNAYGNPVLIAEAPINGGIPGMQNAECLGYVFPNVDSDSDGIINGMELVLGTDPNDNDSDDDGALDGDEYPLAGIPVSDPMDQIPTFPIYESDMPLGPLNFNFVNDGGSVNRDFTISNLGDGDLQVTGCSVNNANFSVSGCPVNIPGSSAITQTITMTCSPTSVASTTTLLGTLTLTTNDPNNATVNYQLNCTALSADAVFADSIEPLTTGGACSYNNWNGYKIGFTAASPLTTPRYNGVCAMQQLSAAMMHDKSPDNETRLRARFYFYAEPSGTGTGSANLGLFNAFASDNSFQSVFKIEFDGTMVTLTPQGVGVSASAAVSSSSWHSVEFDWNQNGQISLWIDSDATTDVADAIGSTSSLGTVIGSVTLGHPSAMDDDYLRLVFDEYESHRTTPIGRLVIGDANGDETVNISDVVIMQNEFIGNFLAPGTPDCNEDTEIDILDIQCGIDIILN